MPQHGRGDTLDVGKVDMVLAAQDGAGFCSQNHKLRCPRTGAVVDVFMDRLERLGGRLAGPRRAGGGDQPRGVGDDAVGYGHATHQLLQPQHLFGLEQQVFLKLLESWHKVQPETAKGWLFTAAYHEALARRRRRLVDEAALNRLWARPVWQCGSEPPDPAARLVREHEVDEVRRAVRELPELQRDVVERRIYRDQTFAVIAQETGCPLNTLLSRMRLAIEKLTRLLENSR